MTQRIDYRAAVPEGYAAMLGLENYVQRCGLPRKLLELIRMRVSQMNGCAHCLDMHSKDASAIGESEQRLHVLVAWREAPFFDERERAALEWSEAVTRMSAEGVTDETYERARRQFTERDLVNLTLAVIAINGWNRLAIPFRTPVGNYQPTRE